MKKIYLVYPKKLGTIAPEIYGHFSEHIGGVFYDGLWVGKDSDIPNIRGFRKDLVEKLISQHEKENVFVLMQMIMNQNSVHLFHQAELILGSKDSNVIQVLSLLLRNYRISWKAALLGAKGVKEIGVPPKAVTKMSDAACSASMDCIQDTISGIKTGKYKEQEGFILCLSKLMECAKLSGKSY